MRISALYAETSVAPRKDATLYLKRYSRLLNWQPYKENILDIGCGDGSVTREVLYPYLEDHLEKLLAVDLSEEMINYAKENNDLDKIIYKPVDLDNEEDVLNLEIKFDHIFSFYCIHWIADQRSLFKRFFNILNPGGQIFITTLSDSSLHKTFKKYLTEKTWAKYLPGTSGFTDYTDQPEEFVKNLLEETGFDVELCITEKQATLVDDFKGFIRSLVSVHRFINYIPVEFKEDYIQDHIKNNCKFSLYSEETGKYSWTYTSFVIVATKK